MVPTSLQIGWEESPPYFCAASETAHDLAVDYIETPTGSFPSHKLENWAIANKPEISPSAGGTALRFIIEVYVNNFIAAIIPTTPEEIEHVARGVLHGILMSFLLATMGRGTPSPQRNFGKGTAHSPHESASWVLTSMALTKQCG